MACLFTFAILNSVKKTIFFFLFGQTSEENINEVFLFTSPMRAKAAKHQESPPKWPILTNCGIEDSNQFMSCLASALKKKSIYDHDKKSISDKKVKTQIHSHVHHPIQKVKIS